MHDTSAMNATRKCRGGGAPKEAPCMPMPAGSLPPDEDAVHDFLQHMLLARPIRSHIETNSPLAFLEMRAAQMALMLAPPSRGAKDYGLPDNAVANAVAKHLSNKQGFEARIAWPLVCSRSKFARVPSMARASL